MKTLHYGSKEQTFFMYAIEFFSIRKLPFLLPLINSYRFSYSNVIYNLSCLFILKFDKFREKLQMRVFPWIKHILIYRIRFYVRVKKLLFFQSILIAKVASTVQSTRTYIYFVNSTSVKFIHVINDSHKICKCGRSVSHRMYV